jgi:hypothetical protein
VTAPWRRTRAKVAAVAGLAGVLGTTLLAGCADFLATPADGARISLSLQPGPPAFQTGADSAFDAVDELSVRILRRQEVVMADSFAVSAAAGVIRQVILVPVESAEETLELYVTLYSGGRAEFFAVQSLRVVRGALTTVEVDLVRAGLVAGVDPARTAAGLGGATVPPRQAPDARAGNLP